MSTTCGCTAAEVEPRALDPGHTLRVDATLALSSPEAKAAQVLLSTDLADGPLALTLRATARRRRDLLCSAHVDLRPGAPATIRLYAIDHEGDAPPAPPALRPPAGVTVAVAGWELVETRRPESGLPARWEAVATLTLAGALPPGQSLAIDLPGSSPRTISIGLAE